jgi:hypothetical protein
MQSDASHSALPSTIFKAETGHPSTQAPHPRQVSLSILTAIVRLLDIFSQLFYLLGFRQGKYPYFSLLFFLDSIVLYLPNEFIRFLEMLINSRL